MNNSHSYAINNKGQVVGSVLANNTAFLWSNELGYKNLQSLLSTPLGQPWSLISAEAINDTGIIVGWGYDNDSDEQHVHGFIMIP